jgi:hypothetical protein
MVISKDRYLDDTRRFHLELALTTRHTAMHSLLSSLSAAEREAISDVLVRALQEITELLRPHVSSAAVAAGSPPAE